MNRTIETATIRLMLFNDVSHYDDVPERILTAHLSKWWNPPEVTAQYQRLMSVTHVADSLDDADVY